MNEKFIKIYTAHNVGLSFVNSHSYPNWCKRIFQPIAEQGMVPGSRAEPNSRRIKSDI